MRLKRALRTYGLVALAIPGILLLTGISTLADASPSPSGAPLPGDPTKGAATYSSAGCTACHGASLEGTVGAALNPIDKMPGIADTLDPTYLIGIITNGRQHQPGDPRQTDMPAKGGDANLTEDDIKNLAAFIIQQNREGSPPLTANELAKRTMTWVGISIIGMLFITFLLAQYNMRWIARRAAARRQK